MYEISKVPNCLYLHSKWATLFSIDFYLYETERYCKMAETKYEESKKSIPNERSRQNHIHFTAISICDTAHTNTRKLFD